MAGHRLLWSLVSSGRLVTAAAVAASAASAAVALLLLLRKCGVDLAALALDVLRALQQILDAVAAAEVEAGRGEVVVRPGLVAHAGALELRHGLLEEREGALVVAGL